MIAKELQPLAVPVKKLKPHPDNPRRGDVRGIKESLERFGQVRPILADKAGVVIAGNHTLEAALELGWEEVAVVRTSLKGEEALAYLVADNRLPEKATYDERELANVLSLLNDAEGLVATGYDETDMRDLIQRLEDEQTPPEDFPSFDDDIKTEYECPRCKYSWSGQPKPGADPEETAEVGEAA